MIPVLNLRIYLKNYVRIWVSLLKIRGLYRKIKYPKYFSLKMNMEKSIFHFEKQNLEHIGNFVHTTEYLAFGKALLVRLYLKVKVYITTSLSVYIIYWKSHALNEVSLLDFYNFEDFSDLKNLHFTFTYYICSPTENMSRKSLEVSKIWWGEYIWQFWNRSLIFKDSKMAAWTCSVLQAREVGFLFPK